MYFNLKGKDMTNQETQKGHLTEQLSAIKALLETCAAKNISVTHIRFWRDGAAIEAVTLESKNHE